MSLSAVRAALDTVKPVESTEEVAYLCKERDRLRALHAELLPLEARAKHDLEIRGKELTTRIERAELAEQYSGLSILPNSVLSWTVRQPKAWRWAGIPMNPKVPAFAYIPAGHAECELTVGGGMINSHLPKFVTDEYEKALQDVWSWVGPNNTFSWLALTYQYTGIVPDEIRAAVREEQKADRFDSIAFICEVDRWEITGQKNPPPQLMDPIVVGVKGETMFVLASFDPTPTEEYLLREFAS